MAGVSGDRWASRIHPVAAVPAWLPAAWLSAAWLAVAGLAVAAVAAVAGTASSAVAAARSSPARLVRRRSFTASFSLRVRRDGGR
jgi:hypothetical protein